jgi:HEAT repeat protein
MQTLGSYPMGETMRMHMTACLLVAVFFTPWNRCWPGDPAPSDPVSKGKPLSAWIKALKDPDYQTRAKAAKAIAALGPKAKAALPAIREILEGRKADARVEMAAALWKIDKAEFTEILTSKQRDSLPRWAVVLALTAIGTEAKELASHVLEIAGDMRHPDYAHALRALGYIGADPDDAVPLLRAALRERSGNYAPMMSAQSLGQYGAKAKDALPELRHALEDPDPLVRVDAAGACWKIEPNSEEVVPVFLAALKDESEGSGARGRAIYYIASVGAEAKDAFPVLLEIWKSDSTPQFNRELAATALKAIDAKAAEKEGVK